MFSCKKPKNIFYGITTGICLMLIGICSLFIQTKAFVFADTLSTLPTYFSAKNGLTVYTNGDTVFLSSDEKLTITLGKPSVVSDELIESGYTNKNDIGIYGTDNLINTFSLMINGTSKNISNYVNNIINVDTGKTSVEFVDYFYIANATTNPSEINLSYFEMTLDLENTTLFPSGEYTLTFTNYTEKSQTDFGYVKNNSFSVTFYVFNTNEYFETDLATSQNTNFDNVRLSNPTGTSYRNYYYFNYSNFTSTSTTENLLPALTYDANKFIVSVEKSVGGSKNYCTISKYNTNLVTLGTSTTTQFLTATHNIDTNKITINFNDVGEYVIKYTYIYQKNSGEIVFLQNNLIENITQKDDVLYIFGYQMFYSGATSINEFKYIQNGTTGGINSADISYTIPVTSLSNTSTTVIGDNGDETIRTAISTNSLVSASSNQPAITTYTNATLKQDYSYYYTYDKTLGDWTKSEGEYVKTAYTNNPFTLSGTYLLKVVYTFDNYFNDIGNLESGMFFVQYFYFTITNTIPTLSIADAEKSLSTNSYTNLDTTVSLSGQSIFNSAIRANIYAKNFLDSSFPSTPSKTLYGTTTSVSETFTDNKNYLIVLVYGKTQNKTQLIYFNIDKTDFNGVNILPVNKSTSNSYYIKDTSSPVSFFTSEDVIVEWNEKASGASSVAYYKYVPFKKVATTTGNQGFFTATNAIPTDYELNLDKTKTYVQASYSNSKNTSLVSGSNVFTNQGLYIVYIIDEAGNEKYISFCIDKSEMQVWQYSLIENQQTYHNVQNFNVVSTDTTIQWGKYKFIYMNILTTDIATIADSWVKKVVQEQYKSNANLTDNIKSRSTDSKLYFAVEISNVYVLQKGNNFTLKTAGSSFYYEIILLSSISGYQYANELTYVFYFIDESNKLFANTANLSYADFVINSDKSYEITTSSDSSDANIIINGTSTNVNDVSKITKDSNLLLQAGFADSKTQNTVSGLYSDSVNLRSKYYFTTGGTISGDIPILSYIIKLTPSTTISVSKITMLYYPFVKVNGVLVLSEIATELVIYDADSSINLTKTLSGDFAGYSAYNLNAEFNIATNSYRTLDGKYVVLREYTSTSILDNTYDFANRESVFIVDRQDIVSSPETYNNEYKSYVGGDIFINVLDNAQGGGVQFNNIYSARNNDTYILQTNKLPVVVYIPITKYGYTAEDNDFYFYPDTILKYFFQTTTDSGNELLTRYTTALSTTNSKLSMVYFGGETPLTSNYWQNRTNFQNSSFDLTVKITNSNGNVISLTTNANMVNYYLSANLTEYGIYYVEITQNNVSGRISPNVYKTFKFTFQIVEQPPVFSFVDGNDTTNSAVFNTDQNGVSYTNSTSTVKVVWTDPANDKYLAKVDMTNDGNGNAKGIYYYFTTTAGTKIGSDQYISLSNITTTDKTHSAVIDISGYNSGTILCVYMQYEGTVINQLTSITKKLYIDKDAPMTVLETLISATTTNGIAIASQSRNYVTADGNTATTLKSYNVTKTTGALANYCFAVKKDLTLLSSLFTTKLPTSLYYVNGFDYYIKHIADIDNYTITDIASAKNAAATHTTSIANMSAYNYYEIIEIDLAGNIAIYTIYLVGNEIGNIVLEFEKENTELNTETTILYQNLQETQSIFAKSYFNITYFDLYRYNFLTFSVDGVNYFKSSSLESGQFYNLSTWTNFGSYPEIVNMEDIFSFTAPSKHTLYIIDPTNSINYTFNIYITNTTLTYSLLASGEGVSITATPITNEVQQYPVSMKIYSYENNRFTEIYNYSTFVSNSLVTYSLLNNVYSFVINNPLEAYKYSFADNYGQTYLEYHTTGDIKLNETDKVKNYIEQVIITDDEDQTNSWYAGLSNLTYNYNASEYTAYVKIYALIYNTILNRVEWKFYNTYTNGVLKTNGYEMAVGVDDNKYFSCTKNNSYQAVNQITFFSPTSTEGLDVSLYNGGVIKIVVTLENNRENSTSTNKTDRLVISNLKLINNLTDKNGESQNDLFDGGALFAGQLTISYSTISLTNPFVFPLVSTLTFNDNSPSSLTNYTVVSEAGTYYIKNYVVINNQYYLLETQSFIISESSSEFYKVVMKNTETQKYEIVQATGNEFQYNNITCYYHYIVNSDDFDILNNQNQNITRTLLATISPNQCITYIYLISNYDYLTAGITPYEVKIAVSYIPFSNSILTASKFTYSYDDGINTALEGISKQIVITQENSNLNSLIVKFNAYYGIKENKISVRILYGEDESVVFAPAITTDKNGEINSFTITTSGIYTLIFTDIAGNTQYFSSTTANYYSNNYKITFIKGVAFEINGANPIQNGIYNDTVTITLPNILKNVYDVGGKPKITVTQNGKAIVVTANSNGEYVLSGAGYYKVYFNAKIKNADLRQESYEFQIISSKEYRTSFEYSQYGNYEIISVKKNATSQDYSNYFAHNLTTKNLKTIYLSLYDEKTGEGQYEITIATNSVIVGETFTFNFKIKNIGIVPVEVSANEGQSTTNNITVAFNAYDLYSDIGECKIIVGNTTVIIDEDYINSLSNYYKTYTISEVGTYFVQVYTSSDKLIYSYKVIKAEPLNAVSIILIVSGSLAVVTLTVIVSLLRKRMKIR